jgi:hypothetical protein
MAAEDDLATKWEQVWPLIVAKAWADAKYMKALKADPEKVLKKEGLPLLPGVKVTIVTKKNYPAKKSSYPAATMCLSIPDKPAKLKTQDLNNLINNAVVASDSSGTSCCC